VRRGWGALAAATLLAVACAPRQQESELEPLETEEVGGAPDSTADLTTDAVGPRPVEGLSGVLPSGFPRDLPVVTPSSLVDFGEEGSGHYVLIVVGGSQDNVRQRQIEALRAGGWTVTGGPREYRLQKGGTSVRLSLAGDRAATELRFLY
jgi:hypothetical protein